jgi:hypothetical protein
MPDKVNAPAVSQLADPLQAKVMMRCDCGQMSCVSGPEFLALDWLSPYQCPKCEAVLTARHRVTKFRSENNGK